MPRRRRRRGSTPEPYHVTVVRYVGEHGERCKKDDPGARKVVEKTDAYYADIAPPGGGKPVRTPLGTSDAALAWEELRKRLRANELAALGLGPRQLEHAARPLSGHVEDWCSAVRDSGTTEKQVRRLRADVLALAELAGWKRLGDIDEDSCLACLARLQKGPGRGTAKEGRSSQTRNHYLSHVRQFVRWAVRARRLGENPLVGLSPVSIEGDIRHARRSPADQEVSALFDYLHGRKLGADGAPIAPSLRGGRAPAQKMTGPQRALAYAVAMATGFRADEVRSLSAESFDLEKGEVTVKAAYSKRRRTDTQNLPSWLVEDLRAYLALHPEGRPWEAFPEAWPGRLLKDDLAAAGVPYVVEGKDGPLYFDFHSLRHWYVTWAANLPGMDLRTLLSLTRLSSPELALRVYGKAREDSMRKAAGQVPPIGRPGPPAP